MATLISGATRADDPVTDFFLGGIEDKAENLMEKARSEANAVAWGVADAAKSVIEAWKLSNAELLDKAFSGLSVQQRELFNNMDETLTRLENNQELVVRDAEKLTAEWSGVIKNLPFTNHDPEVLNYRPRVIVPIGEGTVPLVVTGPKLSSAEPSFNSSGKAMPVGRSTDHELLVQLNRGDLTFEETKSSFAQYKLTFDSKAFSWWQPWTWWSRDRITRDTTIWLLPKQMAAFTIVPMLPSEDVAAGTYGVQVGARGKDSAYPQNVPLAPLWVDQGYVYDAVAIAQNKFFSDAGGDKASCSGAKIDSIGPLKFTFMIQLGHRTVGGSKRDAWVNCNLALPIVKKTPSRVVGDEISGVLNWTDDKLQPLPEDTLDYTISLKMFNGRTHVLTKETSDPSGVVTVERVKQGILFKPKPPRDF
ncbi:hypothetical protein [Mesorhizobium sp.]|uniref:hypothetical protein n=1 Tax=Mesorhizobium sp. TaxID=1871066 RepID=UPI000FE7916E|nr:hypothetical protein [Mesorhizobium sp.]RWP68182.1 MAG: hypothetical protein EOR07_08180 [Mesorhizobium sp.]